MYLRPLVTEIKKKYSSHPEITNLNNLKVPQVLGGEIDVIIRIQYANTEFYASSYEKMWISYTCWLNILIQTTFMLTLDIFYWVICKSYTHLTVNREILVGY